MVSLQLRRMARRHATQNREGVGVWGWGGWERAAAGARTTMRMSSAALKRVTGLFLLAVAPVVPHKARRAGARARAQTTTRKRASARKRAQAHTLSPGLGPCPASARSGPGKQGGGSKLRARARPTGRLAAAAATSKWWSDSALVLKQSSKKMVKMVENGP